MIDKTLIIGATSSLGIALCRQIAKTGSNLVLCGRNVSELQILQQDLQVRSNVEIAILQLDLAQQNLDIAKITAQDFSAVYMVAGDMGSNDQNDLENIAHIININFTAPAKILTALAAQMEAKKQGNIVVISSVAGDRGRQSNYPYGSAKAGLSEFASGLRNRLCKAGVHVMTVKPGFIDTPMTYAMNSPLIASREYVAEKIVAALAKGKDSIYVPFFWRYIMLIIKNIPEFIFKKLGL